MDKQTAEFLADTITNQFNEWPLEISRIIPIGDKKQQLVDILKASEVWPHPQRMQFETSGGSLDSPGKFALQYMSLRRIFTTYNTDYKPENASMGWLVEWWQGKKEEFYNTGKSTYDAEVLGRVLRRNEVINVIRARNHLIANLIRSKEPSPAEIKMNSFDYGVIAHLVNVCNARGRHGGNIDVHLPMIFMPLATKEDLVRHGLSEDDANCLGITPEQAGIELDYLARFTTLYQRPSHDACYSMVKKYNGILKHELYDRHIPVEDFSDYWDNAAVSEENQETDSNPVTN